MSVCYGAIRQFLLYLYRFHVSRLAMACLYATTYATSTCAIVAALCLRSPTLIACNKKLEHREFPLLSFSNLANSALTKPPVDLRVLVSLEEDGAFG
jgi:hypothetical protein